MEEEEYINIDDSIRKTPILTFEEIVEIVRNEHIEETRKLVRKRKDKGMLILLFININIFRRNKEKLPNKKTISNRRTIKYFFVHQTLKL
jgi:hypothetical protein